MTVSWRHKGDDHDARILDELYAMIESRRDADPEQSWTAKLLAEAPDLPARKLGEKLSNA